MVKKTKKNSGSLKQSDIEFWLCFVIGIIILIIGFYLNYSNQVSGDSYLSRSGQVQQGMVTGYSAIAIGAFFILLALFARVLEFFKRGNLKK